MFLGQGLCRSIQTYIQKRSSRLAKAAARNRDGAISNKKLSKGTLKNEVEEETKQKWQNEWNECRKATVTKQFFPNVQGRLKMKINITLNFATMVTGQNQGLPPSLQDNGTCNMCLQQWRTYNRPFTLSMHTTSYTKKTS
jgi:hypothetical protein